MTDRREFVASSVSLAFGKSKLEVPSYLNGYEELYAKDPRQAALKWFKEAKFGLFLHYGLYSLLKGHYKGKHSKPAEWVLSNTDIALEEYDKLAEHFTAEKFDVDFITEMALNAGMKYINITTRHHDSFCLWDTKQTDHKSINSAAKRDLIAELATQCQRKGLGLCLYSSHGLDWRHPHAPESMACDENAKRDMQKYADFMSAQITELNTMARQLQPHILINNRSGESEDFGTPEQNITPEKGGRAWETCMTINNAPNWGNIHYSIADKNAGEILYNLIQAVRLGGNFLFNIGPDEKGYATQRDRQGLDRIGKWLEVHGEAVYGTYPEGIYPTPSQGPCYQYGMFTCKSNIAYFTIFYYPGDYVIISKLGPAIRDAQLLTTGQPLVVERMTNERWKISGLPQSPPGDLAPVIKLEFESPPYVLPFDGASWLDGQFEAPHPTQT